LWRRFGAGDGSAFAQLYRDHHRDVFRYCRSLLRDEEDAHDAAQGTWTAIWTTPDAARRAIPLRPWLFRVAHNEAINVMRRRRPHDALTDLELPALDDVAGDVELRDRLATLRADLVNLPERQRVALLLREVGGLGHTEIAEVFGISAAAAKQTIYEARRALVEAEGGRSMACDLVQRAISDGDGRVRRGRRLSAHLRGCATCRTFADAVGRRRRDLHLLFPTPAALGLMARAVAGAGAGAGGAGGGIVAAGGSVAAKLAVAVVLVAAAGVGGRHELAHAGGDAKGAMASRAVVTAPRRSVGAATGPAAAPRPEARRPGSAATASGGGPGRARDAGRPSHSAGSASSPAPNVASAAAAQPTPASPGRGGDASAQTKATGAAEPSGQARKAAGAESPGQARKAAGAESPGQAKRTGAAESPGQVKKAAGAESPGQARKAAGAESPGQAKKAGAAEPPGSAKKTGAAEAPGPAAKAGDDPAVAPPPPTSLPAPAGNASADTPPGQARADASRGQSKK
jgi:RNA polymerase sigma factor (sigma-70 family)